MAWTDSNPVVVGAATKKGDFDAAFDNSQYLKDSVGDHTLVPMGTGNNGTAAAPAITFRDDIDTGIYRAAANQVGVAVNGVEALKVTASTLVVGGTNSSVYDVSNLTASRNHALPDAAGDISLRTDTKGLVIRPQFTWGDADTITMSAGAYHFSGTTDRLVYWDSLITFDFGPGGSNALSAALGASQWQKVWLDPTAISSDLLTASDFRNNTATATWSESKHGWYNGDYRCVLMVRTDGSNNILEFHHDGGDYVLWADQIEDLATKDVDAWEDLILTIPPVSTKAKVTFTIGTDAETFYWRTNGQSGSTGHIAVGAVNGQSSAVTVLTDSAQTIEVKAAASDTSTLAANTHGWYLPRGM